MCARALLSTLGVANVVAVVVRDGPNTKPNGSRASFDDGRGLLDRLPGQGREVVAEQLAVDLQLPAVVMTGPPGGPPLDGQVDEAEYIEPALVGHQFPTFWKNRL